MISSYLRTSGTVPGGKWLDLYAGTGSIGIEVGTFAFLDLPRTTVMYVLSRSKKQKTLLHRLL